jgi:hypothetical protein
LLRKEEPMADHPTKDEKAPTPGGEMSQEEREAYIDKTEEFEGPDRREVRDDETKHSHEPGVSRS